MCDDADLRPDMPEVTTGSRGYKQARVKGQQADKFCHIMFSIVYRNFIIFICIFEFMYEFVYLIYYLYLLNLCIY